MTLLNRILTCRALPLSHVPLAVLADLIQAGTPGSIAAGVIIFVVACMGFIVTGLWIVFANVHRNDSRKAHWVVPRFEDDEVCILTLRRQPPL